MSKADPEGVHILDVRTFEEYVFVGHVETAKKHPPCLPEVRPGRPLHAC
jgi:hypothetical protein